MVKATYVDKNGVKKGAWSEEEDNKLRDYIQRYGHWNWRLLPKFAGVERCGKSCRLRWMNYLKPGVKRGNYSEEERDLIAKLHDELGNRWSAIAEKLPGRTDNDIKNYWHTHIKINRKKSSGNKSGQQVEISHEEQQSSEVTHNQNLAETFPASDITSVAPKARSTKLEKSEVSSNIFILESSIDVDGNSGAFVDKNCKETSSELIPSFVNSVATYDSANISDLLSGFHESFWTQPFMVDTYSDNHDYNFCVLDEGGILSPQLSCFDDNVINML